MLSRLSNVRGEGVVGEGRYVVVVVMVVRPVDQMGGAKRGTSLGRKLEDWGFVWL